MNFIELLFGEKHQKRNEKKPDRVATDEEFQLIRQFIDNIADSSLVDDSESRRGVNVYKYTDSTFTIIKTVYFYPDGTRKINRSIVLENGFEVYNGNAAVKVNKWLKHLSDVNDVAVKEPVKKLTFKRR